MATYQRIAERYESALKQNKKAVKELFDEEINQAKSAQKFNKLHNDLQMVMHWKQYESKMQSLKKILLSKITTP